MTTENSKLVISLDRRRLASTAGPVIIVEPSVPTPIPKALYALAAQNGCVDYNPKMIEAFKAAMAAAETAGQDEPKIDIADVVRNAVTQVLAAKDDNPHLCTSAGVPRVPAVRVAFETLCASAGIDPGEMKITQELVASTHAELTASLSHEVPSSEGPRYPVGGDLEGEEVGGVDDDLLERVTSVEE